MYTLVNPKSGKKHTTTIEVAQKVQKLLDIVESNGDKLELMRLYIEISDFDLEAIDLFFQKTRQ